MWTAHSADVIFAAISIVGIANAVYRSHTLLLPELTTTKHVKHHRALSSIVTNFAALGQKEATERLIAMLDTCLDACSSTSTDDGRRQRRNEWATNRLLRDTVRHCKQMIRDAKQSRDAAIIEILIQLSENDLPQLESIIDKLTQNLILDRD